MRTGDEGALDPSGRCNQASDASLDGGARIARCADQSQEAAGQPIRPSHSTRRRAPPSRSASCPRSSWNRVSSASRSDMTPESRTVNPSSTSKRGIVCWRTGHSDTRDGKREGRNHGSLPRDSRPKLRTCGRDGSGAAVKPRFDWQNRLHGVEMLHEHLQGSDRRTRQTVRDPCEPLFEPVEPFDLFLERRRSLQANRQNLPDFVFVRHPPDDTFQRICDCVRQWPVSTCLRNNTREFQGKQDILRIPVVALA